MIYYCTFKGKRSKFRDCYVEVDANTQEQAVMALLARYPNEKFDVFTGRFDPSEYKRELPRINVEESNTMTGLPHDIPEG